MSVSKQDGFNDDGGDCGDWGVSVWAGEVESDEEGTGDGEDWRADRHFG